MTKKIFIFSFIFAALCQWFVFSEFGVFDFTMWADQAKYVQTNNPIQFDYLQAYGHPGGPIIEGTILIHSLFHLSYENALTVFMSLLGGLAIAGITLICFLFLRNNLWWPVVLIGLSFSPMYGYSTPPSTLAAILIVFLWIFSIYIYERDKINFKSLTFLSFILGFIIATRLDIGSLMALSLLLFIKPKLSWREVFYVTLGVIAVFIILDPFMWFMPIGHIKDLWFKITYHYEEFTPTKLGWLRVFNISTFAGISFLLSLIFVSEKNKLKSPIPIRFIYIFILTTLALYVVFLTSRYQAERYFLPLILIWQILLPIFVFTLTNRYWPLFAKKLNIGVSLLLGFYPILIMLFSYYINKSYNI
jgi:hypothetical protein